MTAIALCYASTPILQLFRKYPLASFVLIVSVGLIEFTVFQIRLGQFSWLWLYAFGYYYTSIESKLKDFVAILSIVALTIILCNISWDIVIDYRHSDNIIFHNIAGVTLCTIGLSVLSHINLSKVVKRIKKLDEYSYSIYLTHHIFIFGAFSLAFENKVLGTSLILILSTVSAYCIICLSNKVKALFF